MRKGFTLIELLIVVAIIAILAAIAVPNFLEAQIRSKVSRVRSDQRSMATALASYYVDNNGYPFAVVLSSSTTAVRNNVLTGSLAATAETAVTIPGPQPITQSNMDRPTFAVSAVRAATGGPEFSSLTTPISYISSYFRDPFSARGQETFTYLGDGPGFLLVSYGPDADEGQGDADPQGLGSLVRELRIQFNTPVETPFNGRDLAGSRTTLMFGQDQTAPQEAFPYDPTNGTTSTGDVYRVSD
jgi:prepilin-type N-terminal cleavage/methylation domain-containing protein